MARAARRGRRTYRDIFLDELTQLSGNGERLVSNAVLLERLNWDAERYRRIRSELLDADQIVIGRGRGGTVGLTAPPDAARLKVFISYCHADEGLKNKLLAHLKPLERMNLIESWHDRDIGAGQDWAEQIDRNLDQADIILMLVSVDFINSEYCWSVEMQRALERSEDASCAVVPIIMRNCLWKGTPLASLQALPKDARAVASWHDVDEALTDVAEGIRKVAHELFGNG